MQNLIFLLLLPHYLHSQKIKHCYEHNNNSKYYNFMAVPNYFIASLKTLLDIHFSFFYFFSFTCVRFSTQIGFSVLLKKCFPKDFSKKAFLFVLQPMLYVFFFLKVLFFRLFQKKDVLTALFYCINLFNFLINYY